MKNVLQNVLSFFSDPKVLFSKLAKPFLIITAVFSFTASAAMGLDGAVINHGLGVATFVFGIVLTAIWITDAVLKGLWKTYKEWRGEESVDFIVSIAYTSLAFVSILLTIVALAVH